MPFQKVININPPLAVEGDFASAGVYHSVLAGSGKLIAGVNGVTVGRFGYADATTGQTGNAKVAGGVLGFVRRGENTAIITGYLDEASMLIPKGFGVTIYDRGDFWAKTTTAATIGQKVFANDTTGVIATGAAGATVAGSTETNYSVASAGAIGDLIKITAQ
jgi:hypothetical protein